MGNRELVRIYLKDINNLNIDINNAIIKLHHISNIKKDCNNDINMIMLDSTIEYTNQIMALIKHNIAKNYCDDNIMSEIQSYSLSQTTIKIEESINISKTYLLKLKSIVKQMTDPIILNYLLNNDDSILADCIIIFMNRFWILLALIDDLFIDNLTNSNSKRYNDTIINIINNEFSLLKIKYLEKVYDIYDSIIGFYVEKKYAVDELEKEWLITNNQHSKITMTKINKELIDNSNIYNIIKLDDILNEYREYVYNLKNKKDLSDSYYKIIDIHAMDIEYLNEEECYEAYQRYYKTFKEISDELFNINLDDSLYEYDFYYILLTSRVLNMTEVLYAIINDMSLIFKNNGYKYKYNKINEKNKNILLNYYQNRSSGQKIEFAIRECLNNTLITK